MRIFLIHAPQRGALVRLAAVLLIAAAFFAPIGPARAAITLAEISATAQTDNTILVRWVTATESNSSQFILYRSGQVDGPWDTEINRQDAKDISGLVGATYTYIDAAVEPGKTYYYVLGELEKTGSLIKYTDARRQATVGQTGSETATPTQTATRTATPTATATLGPQLTATRQFTNTPRPTATKTPSLPFGMTASPAPAGPGPATPLPGATISTPVGAQPGSTPIAPAPAASPVDPGAAPVETAAPVSVPATPAPSAEPATQAPAEATATPQTFGPAGTEQPLLGASTRTETRPTPAPAAQTARNSRLILLLGGLAFGLAALLGGAAFAVWRSRQR